METETARPDLPAMAREVFGEEFHGDVPPAEPELQEPSPAPAPPKHEVVVADDDTLWSNEDIATIGGFNREVEALQRDAAQLAQVKAKLDLNALERTDRARAQMIRTQIREAEAELRQRHELLGQAATAIQSKATDRLTARQAKKLEAEAAKLAGYSPEFDREANISYLRKAGFTDEEIASPVVDSRLARLINKARKYDKLVAGQRAVPKGPKKAPGRRAAAPAKASNLDAAREKLASRGSIDAAVAVLRASRERR